MFPTAPLVWLLCGALGCSKPSAGEAPGKKTEAEAVRSASESRTSSPRVARHALEISAYTATLATDGDDVYVLTSRAAYRARPGQSPERWEIELGDTPALAGGSIVYWLDGKLRRAPSHGGPSEVLTPLPRPPRRLHGSENYVVWEEVSDDASLLRVLAGSEPKTVHRAQGSIEALTLMHDQVYFVERSQDRWRLGLVTANGGAPRYTEPRASRTPALLAAAGDVFFYDGPSSSVRRVTSDLAREEVVARDLICSPLAVTDRVYCAQISLLFEVPRDGGKPRPLVPKRSGTITAVVATRTRVAWLLDAGENRAELELLEL